jgi:hypothetical protein
VRSVFVYRDRFFALSPADSLAWHLLCEGPHGGAVEVVSWPRAPSLAEVRAACQCYTDGMLESVDVLELSVRASNALERARIGNLAQLRESIDSGHLRKVMGVGKRVHAEVENALRQYVGEDSPK